ncbi:Protein of unknown function [Actinokineospora alba]|uniref:DUF4244 domain-containing protein n=1 Tax=Actinokineospora alba TaxID=504798 RepID=A0A1H0T0H8_9PSEU|nr:DUF4244 domain-containing protein [Actinokineospora alba]TDP66459.1 uncharacterized protein DUF4244 [Actinokineospora alba]SDJ52148.1 Protein of unknown function [Actinokineospora alba]SDP47008.1 Protein of unknown function [Actinokineospora alba]
MTRFLHRLRRSDDGMSTVEYAIGTIAAAAFAGILLAVVNSDAVMSGLNALIARAMGGAA